MSLMLFFVILTLFSLAWTVLEHNRSVISDSNIQMVSFTITLLFFLCVPISGVIQSIEKGKDVDLDKKHSIENCDKDEKCFKRLIFQTCYSSEDGYSCRTVKGSERAIGTELVE